MKTYIEELTENLNAMYNGKIGGAALKRDQNATLFLSSLAVGKSAYIYGDYTCYEKIPSENFKLLAIVTENLKIVFHRWKLFGSSYDVPPGYILAENLILDLNAGRVSEKYTELYNALPTEKIDPEYKERYAQDARYNLLVIGKFEELETPKLINKDDIKSILAGYTTAEEITTKYVNDKREQIISGKSRREYIKKLMTEKSVVEPWELELAENLRATNAKTVTVEFSFNGKSASGKIDPQDLLRTLANKTDFSSWNFANATEGKKVLTHLGTDWNNHWNNHLTSEHITRITYKGKTVFER